MDNQKIVQGIVNRIFQEHGEVITTDDPYAMIPTIVKYTVEVVAEEQQELFRNFENNMQETVGNLIESVTESAASLNALTKEHNERTANFNAKLLKAGMDDFLSRLKTEVEKVFSTLKRHRETVSKSERKISIIANGFWVLVALNFVLVASTAVLAYFVSQLFSR